MTDDDAQSTPTPTESTPGPEVVAPTSAEPTPTSPELTSVIEQVPSTEATSVIPEKSHSAQDTEVESRSMSQPTSVAPPSIPMKGRKWNADDRAKSAATHARKKDVHLAKIVEYAKTHGGIITNDEIEKLLHVSDATASRYAKTLVERRVLRQEGKGRGSRYQLLSA